MNRAIARLRPVRALLACGLLFVSAVSARAQSACPSFGWAEGLNHFLAPSTRLPVDDTAGSDGTGADVPDCAFQQWSAEAFIWATALTPSGKPRFMILPTAEDLLTATSGAAPSDPLKLSPARRTEGAHAFVEADGNLLIAKNGHPVYASVHMNYSYFNTAQQNLVVTGAYCTQDPNTYFRGGAAVFKATWLRLNSGEAPPTGAFVTEALVPVLARTAFDSTHDVVQPVANSFVTARVALLGLHVVGYTRNHPEFVWATFEHRLNSPRTTDNTFAPSASTNIARNYTFYTAGTPFSQVNIANPQSDTQSNPQMTFDPVSQTFSQKTQVVLENRTGGASFPTAAQARSDIRNVNAQMQQFFATTSAQQSVFQNYDLIGTLWLAPHSYRRLNPSGPEASADLFKRGVGSVNLANSTAETFQQSAVNTNPDNRVNCFSCHSAGGPQATAPNNLPASAQPSQRQLEISYCGGNAFPQRHISLSHVLEIGTTAAVPNAIGIPHPPAP